MIGTTKCTTVNYKVVVDAKNGVSCDLQDADDNLTLPSINTKVDEVKEDGVPAIQYILAALSPMHRTNMNDESIISSNLTMYTQINAVESNMITTNTNIGNFDK